MTRALRPLVLACGIGALAAGCFPSALPPCTQRAALEARYINELVAGCAGAGSLEACPEFAAIKAAHNARMKAAACRY